MQLKASAVKLVKVACRRLSHRSVGTCCCRCEALCLLPFCEFPSSCCAIRVGLHTRRLCNLRVCKRPRVKVRWSMCSHVINSLPPAQRGSASVMHAAMIQLAPCLRASLDQRRQRSAAARRRSGTTAACAAAVFGPLHPAPGDQRQQHHGDVSAMQQVTQKNALHDQGLLTPAPCCTK